MVVLAAMMFAIAVSGGCPTDDNNVSVVRNFAPNVDTDESRASRVAGWLADLESSSLEKRQQARANLREATDWALPILLDELAEPHTFTAAFAQAIARGDASDVLVVIDFARTHDGLPASLLQSLAHHALTVPAVPPIYGVADALRHQGLAGIAALSSAWTALPVDPSTPRYAEARHEAIAELLPWRWRLDHALSGVDSTDPGVRQWSRETVAALFSRGHGRFDRRAVETVIERLITVKEDAGLDEDSPDNEAYPVQEVQKWLLRQLEEVRVTPVVPGDPPGSGRVLWFYPALLRALVEADHSRFPRSYANEVAWMFGPRRQDVRDVCRAWFKERYAKDPVDHTGAFRTNSLVTMMQTAPLGEHRGVPGAGSVRHSYDFEPVVPGGQSDVELEELVYRELQAMERVPTSPSWPPRAQPVTLGLLLDENLGGFAGAVPARAEQGDAVRSWTSPMVEQWFPVPPVVDALIACGQPALDALLADDRLDTNWRFQWAAPYVALRADSPPAFDALPAPAQPPRDLARIVNQRWRLLAHTVAAIGVPALAGRSSIEPIELCALGLAACNETETIVCLHALAADGDGTGSQPLGRAELVTPVARLLCGVLATHIESRHTPPGSRTRPQPPAAPGGESDGVRDVRDADSAREALFARASDWLRFTAKPTPALTDAIGQDASLAALPPLTGYRWPARLDAWPAVRDLIGWVARIDAAALASEAGTHALIELASIAEVLGTGDALREDQLRAVLASWLDLDARAPQREALRVLPPARTADHAAVFAAKLDSPDASIADLAARRLLLTPLVLAGDGSDFGCSDAIDLAADHLSDLHTAAANGDENARERLSALIELSAGVAEIAESLFRVVVGVASSGTPGVQDAVWTTLATWMQRDPAPIRANARRDAVRDLSLSVAQRSDEDRPARDLAMALACAVAARPNDPFVIEVVQAALAADLIVQNAAVAILIRRDHVDDVVPLAEALPDLHTAAAQRDVIDHLGHRLAIGVSQSAAAVTALLPFLRVQIADAGFSAAQRQHQLQNHAMMALRQSDDPRIAPALTAAVVDGGFIPPTVQILRYLEAHPVDEMWRVYAGILKGRYGQATFDAEDVDLTAVIDFLTAQYGPPIRNALLEAWAEATSLNQLAAIAQVFQNLHIARGLVELEWVRAIARREYVNLTDDEFSPGELPWMAGVPLGVLLRRYLAELAVSRDTPLPPGEDPFAGVSGIAALRDWLGD